MANLWNGGPVPYFDYFASVFTVEDSSNLPTADAVFKGMESERLTDIQIDEDTVKKKLGKLRSYKRSRCRRYVSKSTHCKELQEEICYPVMAIMKASLETDVVPDDWKAANVTPIFKKGSKNEIGNYRPVSLTSQICKLLEMIIRDSLVEHLDSNSLITASQHGFRRGGSCLSNLLQCLDRITNTTDNIDLSM